MIYLGNKQIGMAAFGSKPIEVIKQNFVQPFTVTSSVQMFFDGADWDGSSTLLYGRYSNSTASLNLVSKNVQYDALNFLTSSYLTTTASGDTTPNQQAVTSSIVAIYRPSGSSSDHHGRLLNSINTNWLFGTYGGGGTAGAIEYNFAWYNNNFVILSGSFNNDWQMLVGIKHSANSASVYSKNVYQTGSLQANTGFDGLAINKGQYTENPFLEVTQADVGMFAVYNKELSPTEITQIYQYYQSRFGI